MIKFRPIDEELKNLHDPVAITISEEEDTDSALDGFRVTNSGSVMIPSGLTKPYLAHRPSSTASTMSTSHSSMNSYPPTPQPQNDLYYQQNYHYQLQLQQIHLQQQQQMHYQQQQYQQGYYSPQSVPHYQSGFPRPAPSSLPSSFPEYYSHQSMVTPQPPPYQSVSPLGMSPMGMGYSPMAHHQQSQYHQGYNQHQYPYPTGY